MTFPASARAIEEMVKNRSLQARIARGVVRKAGLTRTVSTGPIEQAPRTIIDAYISPPDSPFARQYRANLSGVVRVRLASESSGPLYVLYSTNLDNTLDPGDWQPLRDTSGQSVSSSSTYSTAGAPLRWFTLASVARADVRLILSLSESAPTLDRGSPFSVALQGDG